MVLLTNVRNSLKWIVRRSAKLTKLCLLNYSSGGSRRSERRAIRQKRLWSEAVPPGSANRTTQIWLCHRVLWTGWRNPGCATGSYEEVTEVRPRLYRVITYPKPAKDYSTRQCNLLCIIACRKQLGIREITTLLDRNLITSEYQDFSLRQDPKKICWASSHTVANECYWTLASRAKSEEETTTREDTLSCAWSCCRKPNVDKK